MAVTVGLDIGGGAVRAAAVDIGKAKPVLRRYAEMPLPPQAVLAGEVMDEGAVMEALSALWKRSKLPRRRIVVGTANQRVVVRQVDVPRMEEDELAQALPFQVQDSIPIPVDEAILDYVPIEEFTTPDGELMMSILAVAAQRQMVDDLVRISKGAGLSPEAVDLQPFALARALLGAGEVTEPMPECIVDIGASLTQIVIAEQGFVRFVRILPRGGDAFTTALTEGLDVETETAEELKRALGIEPEGASEEETVGDEHTEARRVLTEHAEGFIEEIRGSISYYLGQRESGKLHRLVVAGNGARLPHLANRLGKALQTPIEPARILDDVDVGRVQLSPDELDAAQPVLPTAVGLALWGAG